MPRAGPLVRFYYLIKYRPFARERRPHDGRRGLLALQIDALVVCRSPPGDRLGYCPTIARLLRETDTDLRRWFCGLPSATPYCQAGIFHGKNAGIPAFRFYDKALRQVVTCNSPEGVQYIRDRIDAPGALAGGSSYVNLLDGDAQTVAFTVATRQRMSVYRRLGGTRMLLLIALHPVRDRSAWSVQSVVEWLREEWERFRGELTGRSPMPKGSSPISASSATSSMRELQTMAILLDLYLGVPIIYSTFMQYDELAHHFGPRSRQALARPQAHRRAHREILRMVRVGRGPRLRRRDPLGSRHDARDQLPRRVRRVAGRDGRTHSRRRARNGGREPSARSRASPKTASTPTRGRRSSTRPRSWRLRHTVMCAGPSAASGTGCAATMGCERSSFPRSTAWMPVTMWW